MQRFTRISIETKIPISTFSLRIPTLITHISDWQNNQNQHRNACDSIGAPKQITHVKTCNIAAFVQHPIKKHQQPKPREMWVFRFWQMLLYIHGHQEKADQPGSGEETQLIPNGRLPSVPFCKSQTIVTITIILCTENYQWQTLCCWQPEFKRTVLVYSAVLQPRSLA